jgi:hypothetical protein
MCYKCDESLKKVANRLPPEPVPGQFYRTRGDEKVWYIGKDSVGHYCYENTLGIRRYELPFQMEAGQLRGHYTDIVAPWTKPLPAMEIKRWGIVYSKDTKTHPRGYFITASESKAVALAAITHYYSDIPVEIVELTGTLPAKEYDK